MTDSTVSAALQLFPDSVFLRPFCTCVLQEDRVSWGSSSRSGNIRSSNINRSSRGPASAAVLDQAAVERWYRVLAPPPTGSSLEEQRQRSVARGLSVPDVEERLRGVLPEYAEFLRTAQAHLQGPVESGPITLDDDGMLDDPTAAVVSTGHGSVKAQVHRMKTAKTQVECMDDSFFDSESLDEPLCVHKCTEEGPTQPGTTPPLETAPRPAPVQQGPQLFAPNMRNSTRAPGARGFVPAPAVNAAAATPIDLDADLGTDLVAVPRSAAPGPAPRAPRKGTVTPDQFLAMKRQTPAPQPPATDQEDTALDELDALDDL